VPATFTAPPVNSGTEGLLDVALGNLVIGLTIEAEAVETIEVSVVVKDSIEVSARMPEDVVKNSVSISVSVTVSIGVSAGRSDDAVVVGSSAVVDWRIRVETPNSIAQSAGSMSSGQQYVAPAVSEVQ
jgi:hypothetical protein